MTLAVSADMELILLQRDNAADSKSVPALPALSQGTPSVSLLYSFHSVPFMDSIGYSAILNNRPVSKRLNTIGTMFARINWIFCWVVL